jgi:hypothetical protein
MAMSNVENDHSNPFAIKGSLEKYTSLIKNITARYSIISKRNPL